MKDKSSIPQWQQANELFDFYMDKPIEESISELENDKMIPTEVKVLVVRLLQSLSLESTTIEQADLSLFDSLNETFIDLTGTIIGEYHLLCLIGEGGMAQVYKAERLNTTIQKFVAVKVLTIKQKLSKSLENLFEKEQVTLSKLSHSNIISFHHGGISDKQIPYLVMEYIDKAENATVYCQRKNLNTEQIIRLLLPIIDAVGYAHQQLIVHKDIKPSNILIDPHGKPYLLDFGISSILEKKPNDAPLVIYTPDFASPEQYLKKEITTSSDIFSFTATLLDLMTGKKRTTPSTRSHYDYSSDKAYIENILTQSKLDDDLKNIIKKGLKEKPTQRYQSAQELKLDLQSWLKFEPVSATAHNSFYIFKKFIKRNSISSALVSILFVAIVFSLSAMFTQMNTAEKEAGKARQVSDFLIESIQSSDPDLTKGKDVTVKELLNNAKIKIQETSLDDDYLNSSLEQNIGIALMKTGQYQEAEKLLIKAIGSDKNNFDARIALAQLYLKQKQLEQSQEQYRYLRNNNSKLSQQQQLRLQQVKAKQLLLNGDFNQAVNVISSILDSQQIDMKLNIENHLILADILDKKGDSKKAVAVLQKTLDISNQTIGKISTTSTNISNLLADALTNVDPVPYDKLISIYQQTIKTQIELYGEKHPLVAKTYLQYGFALKTIGEIKQAKEMANKARAIAIDNFGNKHILTAHIDLLLSQIELAQNNIHKAINTLKQVVLIYQSTFGINHFETNQVKTTLALYMIRAGQGKQAIKILQPLYTSQKEQLGENHQATLYVVLNLLKAYNMVGDYKTAISIGKDALAISQQHLGKGFGITIGLQAILGASYLKNTQAKMAIATLKPLLSLPEVNNNGAYHKKIAIFLIKSYKNNGEFNKANQIIQQIINKYYKDTDDLDATYNELLKLIKH